MRPTKYRIWNKTDKKYIYSDEFNQDDSTLFVLKSFFEFVYDSHIISEKEFEEPEQFTGLHDKNGNEIYEGDIIKPKYGNGVYIINDLLHFGFNYYEYFISEENIEIIGNIHENHELLENR